MKKIENYLFDILGLILPGFVSVIVSVSLFIYSEYFFDSSIMSINVDVFKDIPVINAVISNQWFIIVLIISVILIFYIIGNILKVFSKVMYDFLGLIFESILIPIITGMFKLSVICFVYCFSFVLKLCNKEISTVAKKEMIQLYFHKDKRSKVLDTKLHKPKKPQDHLYFYMLNMLKAIIRVYNFVISYLKKIFGFKPEDSCGNESYTENVKKLFNAIYNQDAEFNWYDVYKISNLILSQEKIDTYVNIFMSKYNMYRSFSFICMLNFAYIYFLSVNYPLGNGYVIFYAVNFIVWYAFHDKYKRFWALSGNEAIKNAYVYLVKKQKQYEIQNTTSKDS